MKASDLIERDPEKLGGTPVFFGTRVPIKNLFDCLEDGDGLDEFLDQFPTVTREQALRVLELSKQRLLTDNTRSALMQKARGIWKDRQDLPDMDQLRSEWNRL